MTPEQFDILNGRLTNIETILLRAFTGGSVPFENIVNQVRNYYERKPADKSNSEVPLSSAPGLPAQTSGGGTQKDGAGGADPAGVGSVAAGSVG